MRSVGSDQNVQLDAALTGGAPVAGARSRGWRETSVACVCVSNARIRQQLASPDRSAIRHNSGKNPSTDPCTAAVSRSEFGSRSLKAPLAPSARPERIADKRLPDPPAADSAPPQVRSMSIVGTYDASARKTSNVAVM